MRTVRSQNRILDLLDALARAAFAARHHRLALELWRRVLRWKASLVDFVVHRSNRILGCPAHRFHEVVADIFRVAPRSSTGSRLTPRLLVILK